MTQRAFVIVACAIALATTRAARAQEPATADSPAQLEDLQKQLDAVKAQLAQVVAQVDQDHRAQAESKEAARAAERPPNDPLTFVSGRNELTLYGNLDLSFEDTTKGLENFYASSGDSPVGQLGYLPAISTNLSYVGVRGRHDLWKPDLVVVYQLETQLDISATAGTVNTNSNNDSIVKGALTSRNSFVGFAGKSWGAIKVGKTDAPYKNSTARMNPFVAMLGDYAAIMGNTGGDNRAEFAQRLDHAIWYESPNVFGFTVNALISPGQNRADDNSLIGAGESSCAGGNVPGSGALPPACNDGSFGTAYSANIAYEHGPFYATAAYELHTKTNRTSDLEDGDPRDVGNERAVKLGAQVTFPTATTLSAIFEDMHRTVPSDLESQNERTRNGYWFAISQRFTKDDVASVGWAHANATPGDLPQHNSAGGLNPDNAADMVTLAFRHAFDKSFSVYFDAATTQNHVDAHYDLGAGGRSVTTDCHDATQLAAFDPVSGMVSGGGPHCYTGGKLKGASVGVTYKF